jgi:hypothetical protein
MKLSANYRILTAGFWSMRGASQVLRRVGPAQGVLHMEEPKVVKEREDNASQLNRLIFTTEAQLVAASLFKDLPKKLKCRARLAGAMP